MRHLLKKFVAFWYQGCSQTEMVTEAYDHQRREQLGGLEDMPPGNDFLRGIYDTFIALKLYQIAHSSK